MNTVAANQSASLTVEARRLTPEVQELNDIAQIEIWGTRGRTAGFIDPATGDALAAPIKGVVNEIRENPRYGMTEGEREAEAKHYEDQVQGLLDDDFELCQAKLIMDLRSEDEQSASKMIGKYVAEGMPALTAESKVRSIYAKRDTERLEEIKQKGIFSRAEYEVRKKLRDLAKERNSARVDFAQRLAGRSQRHFLIGKSREEYGEEAIASSRHKYEQARMKLLREELLLLEGKGVDRFGLDMKQAAAVGTVVDEYRLAREIKNREKIASGSYRVVIVEKEGVEEEDVDEEGVTIVERVKSGNPLSRSIASFKDFWERSVNDSTSGKAKRLGVAAGLGVLIGAPAIGESGALLGPMLGAASAGLAANEAISRQLSFRRRGGTAADRRWDKIHDDLMLLAEQGGGRRWTETNPKTSREEEKFKAIKAKQTIKSKEMSLRMLKRGKLRKREPAPIDNLAKFAERRASRDNSRNQRVLVGSMAVGAVTGRLVQHRLK